MQSETSNTTIRGLKWLAAFGLAFWLRIDLDLRVLAILCGADVLSSFFNPQRSLPVVTKRIAMTFLLVGVTHYVFSLAKEQTGLNLGFDVAAVVCTFYILGEVIAVVRNCAAAGLTIPPKLLDALSKAEGITGVEKSGIVGIQLKQDEDSVKLEVKVKPLNGGDVKLK